ncbi:hypothetical protein CJ260_08330 [Megasphaera sp. ASD88]|uniref:hypothetical protein n=1 Tax=Megasphaera TaxID=906 RepID=UPI000BAB868C|nr:MULTISPECIES: hypothetical protein [Megasphaera]PAV38671.1 hypothetical protein CJ260_08330 [Megasphaera sp. ASD88]HJE82643.1 hypothetical protein [Megasphaera stantonii]
MLESLQHEIETYVYIILGTVMATIIKHYLGYVLTENKLLEFLINFIPGIFFLYASSSSYICHLLGEILNKSELTGFIILATFGLLFLSNAVVIILTIIKNKKLNKL